MKNNLISIIIPVYNSEKTLYYTLNSILCQNYQNYEVILVDDGSTDNSSKICKEFIEKSQKFKYFYQENLGVSNARNTGLTKINGDFVLFVDSDDILNEKLFSIIIDNFEEDCELLSFDYIKIYDYDFKLNNLHNKIKKNYIQRNDFIRNTLENGNGFLWNKVYRNQIIENNNLTFQDNISICEDLLFNIQYARYLTKEVHISFTGYGYYQSLNSSFNKVNNLKWFSVTKAFEIIEKELSNISIDLLIFAYYEHLYIDCEAIARNEINYIKYKGIDDIKQNIKKNFFRVILSNKINIKKKIKCIIFFVFPKITFKYKQKKMKGV